MPALVSALAACDGREPINISHWARSIREARLIETTKRGSGASPVTSADAAMLLMALNGATIASEAPQTVVALRDLPVRFWSDPKCYPVPKARERLPYLDEPETFGQSLIALIEHAHALKAWVERWQGRYDLADLRGLKSDQPFMDNRRLMEMLSSPVRITVQQRPFEASILIGAPLRTVRDMSDGFKAFFGTEYDAVSIPQIPDRRPASSFGLPTLLAVHDAVFDVH